MSIHVDDLPWVGGGKMQAIVEGVQQTKRLGSLDTKEFKYCGRWIKQGNKGIEITCPELIGRVRPISLKATKNEKAQLRSNVGQ